MPPVSCSWVDGWRVRVLAQAIGRGAPVVVKVEASRHMLTRLSPESAMSRVRMPTVETTFGASYGTTETRAICTRSRTGTFATIRDESIQRPAGSMCAAWMQHVARLGKPPPVLAPPSPQGLSAAHHLDGGALEP